MGKIIFAFVLLFTTTVAHARIPDADAFMKFGFAANRDNPYQIGSEFGKHPVTNRDLENATPAFRRDALATARVGGGTTFYLGKFNGKHVMATNHHVLEDGSDCLGNRVSFPLLNVHATCKDFFGSWPEIDLALYVIDVPAQDEAKLAAVAGNFAFHKEIRQGENLLTIGFGISQNPTGELMGNQDSDCKVFSNTGDYHLMGDPDSFNPADYKAWSFANGCDVSHGDSGSAMVDRETGEVVGIIWTGKIPKDAKVQDSKYLENMLATNSGEIWTELSYAVPAAKIGEFLDKLVRDGNSLTREARETIMAVLQN